MRLHRSAKGADERTTRNDQRRAQEQPLPYDLRVAQQERRESDSDQRLRRNKRRDDRDPRTRLLYASCALAPFVAAALIATVRPLTLLGSSADSRAEEQKRASPARQRQHAMGVGLPFTGTESESLPG